MVFIYCYNIMIYQKKIFLIILKIFNKMTDFKLQYPDKKDFNKKDLDLRQAKKYFLGIEQTAALSESCMLVFDYYRQQIIYIAPDNVYFTTKNTLKNQKIDLSNLVSLILEKDINIFSKIHNQSLAFLKTQPKDDIKNLALFYNLNLRNLNNEYYLSDIKVKIMQTDSLGNPWLGLFAIKKSEYPNYFLPYFKNVKTNVYNFITIPKLTSYNLKTKQLQTLNLLCRQISLNEIALKLGISLGGIKNRLDIIYKILKVETRDEATDLFIKQYIDI